MHKEEHTIPSLEKGYPTSYGLAYPIFVLWAIRPTPSLVEKKFIAAF